VFPQPFETTPGERLETRSETRPRPCDPRFATVSTRGAGVGTVNRDPADRKEAVLELAGNGLLQRGISDALGVGRMTLNGDLSTRNLLSQSDQNESIPGKAQRKRPRAS